MKTKILVITALLLGGLIFSSCQKDNSLSGDIVPEQSFVVNNMNERDTEPEEYLDYDFRLTNYPEPFYRCTTIEYELPYPADVSMKVCCEAGDSQYAETILVNDRQRQGIHRVEFNSCNLPAGKFIVYLTVDQRTIARTINKIGLVGTECEISLEQ